MEALAGTKVAMQAAIKGHGHSAMMVKELCF